MTGGIWMDEELRNERCYGCLGASFGDCKICNTLDEERQRTKRESKEERKKGKKK